MAETSETSEPGNLLLPVLPLRDLCLFPEASLAVVVSAPGALRALEIARSLGLTVAINIIADPSWDEARFAAVREWALRGAPLHGPLPALTLPDGHPYTGMTSPMNRVPLSSPWSVWVARPQNRRAVPSRPILTSLSPPMRSGSRRASS